MNRVFDEDLRGRVIRTKLTAILNDVNRWLVDYALRSGSERALCVLELRAAIADRAPYAGLVRHRLRHKLRGHPDKLAELGLAL